MYFPVYGITVPLLTVVLGTLLSMLGMAMKWFFFPQFTNNCLYFPVYGMVPHLTVVLGTLLPMLGMAKQDNMKWVLSSGE